MAAIKKRRVENVSSEREMRFFACFALKAKELTGYNALLVKELSIERLILLNILLRPNSWVRLIPRATNLKVLRNGVRNT